MQEKKFYKLVNRRFDKIISGLTSKGKEYSTKDNKLHNFDKGSRMTGNSREKVLMGFLLKHLISVEDIIDNLDKGILPNRELIDQKIGDIINYYILLEASLVDRLENK